nr:hypothetical protein [Tanacetum cinerariifolium]
MLLDFDFDEIPHIEIDLPPMVCKMDKRCQNKKKIMENIMYFNNGAGPSSSVGTPLTQEKVKKWALAHSINMRYEMLEEADKVRLDGKIKLEEERAMVKVKWQTIKEKKDPGAFIFLIRLEGLINENALADTGSDINTVPYRIYEQLGRDDIMKEDRNIIMINYTEAEVNGRITSGAYDHEARSSHTKCSTHVETIEETLLLNGHHEFLEWSGCSREAKSRYNTRLETLLPKLIYSPHIMDWQLLHKIGWGEEIDHMLKISLKEAQSNEEIFFNVAWIKDFNIQEPIYPELCREFYATHDFKERMTGYEKIQKNDLWLLSMFEARRQNGYENVAWVIAKIILRELIDSEDRLIPDILVDDVPRVATQIALRVQRALMQDLYEHIDSMEIRQEAIERMEYIQAYHWDRYQGVFEHMAGVYNVPLQGDYNPPGYAQLQYDQYYQQYYPQQPPQQQHDDEENE